MCKYFCIGIATIVLAFTARAQTVQLQAYASYVTNGVTVTLNDNWTQQFANNNVNFQTATISNTDTAVGVNPFVTNGLLRIKNTSPTNTPNYVSVGTNATVQPFLIYPGQVATIPAVTGDANGKFHCTASNATQTIQFLWGN